MNSTAKAPTVAPLEWVALGGVLAMGVASCLRPETIADGPVVCPLRLLTVWWRATNRSPPRLDTLLRHPLGIATLVLWGAYGALRMVAGN